MWSVLFLTFCVSLTAGRVLQNGKFILVNGEEKSLEWPEKYTVQATKITITANLVEDFVIWRTNEKSRLDKNQGLVKLFKIIDSEGFLEKFEVHPETDKDEEKETVCYDSTYDEDDTEDEDDFEELDDILPDLYLTYYEAEKNETLNNEKSVLFVSHEIEDTYLSTYHKLWAVDSGVLSIGWIPVRYEKTSYYTKLSCLTTHEIWDFQGFEIDFDEDEVFRVEQFGCSEEDRVKVNLHSELVTKELMFINPENKHHVDHVFNSFKTKYDRKYAHEEEHTLRKQIFKHNMKLISSTNHQHLGYKLGVNHLADRTPEEMKKRNSLRRRSEGNSGNVPFPYTKENLKKATKYLPIAFDLRLAGLVTPVQDQQDCGSCWTYGTTSAVEGALARSNGGNLIRLANQALIDCAWAFKDADGCNGGSDDAAYKWMKSYGLPTEEEYGPYKNADGICNINNMTTLYSIKGYTDVTPYDDDALMVALVYHGPVSVSIEATDKFGFYSSGIFYEKDCGSVLDHEMTLVGFGIGKKNKPFWILKNSYGVNWGLDGYMLISAKGNSCGVTSKPTYVVL